VGRSVSRLEPDRCRGTSAAGGPAGPVEGRRRRFARLLAICLVLAAAGACEGGPDRSASQTTAAPGTTVAVAELPTGYLTDAIDLIRQHAFHAGRVDWPAVRAEALRRAGAAPSRARTYDAIRWVLSKLGDHHSFLLTPEQARERTSGGGQSFGLTALFPERVVVDVEPGGAAAQAGVRVGDLVESVDGRPPQGDEVVTLPPPTTGGRPARVRLALRRGEGDRARRLRVGVEAAQAPAARPPTARRLSSTVSLLELSSVASPAGPDAVRSWRPPTTPSAGSPPAGPAAGRWTCDATPAGRCHPC
jgi:hypothetical protein